MVSLSAWKAPLSSLGLFVIKAAATMSASVGELCGLHDAIHAKPADLPAHVVADARREPIVKPRQDARPRHFVRIGPQIGPTVGYPPRGGARHRNLRHVRGSQDGLADFGDHRAGDAVRAGIF